MTTIATSKLARDKKLNSSSNFLRYVHNFRGFAILMIVAGHVLDCLEFNDKNIATIINILIRNATTYFIFIAGFLFQSLSQHYEYKNYLLKKVKYVFIPYLFTSIPAIIFCINEIFYTPPDWFTALISNWSIFGQVLMYLLTGQHLPQLWFIPMITIFYITAPILLWIDKHPKFYWILSVLLIINIVVCRENGNAIKSFIHFLPIYIFGMFYSHFREKVFAIMEKSYFVLLLCFVNLTILEIVVTPRPTEINTLSKLILCMLFMYFLWIAESRLPKLFHDSMGILADLSFGIYFIHEYFLIAYAGAANKFGFDPFWTKANLLTFSLILLFAVGASIVSLLMTKRIFGKKSRFVVGC